MHLTLIVDACMYGKGNMIECNNVQDLDKLIYKRVGIEDEHDIIDIYNILKECGEDMFQNHGLVHWRSPYPIDEIKKDVVNKAVYTVSVNAQSVATFQLTVMNKIGYVSKVAVRPPFSGRGIGKKCLDFIFELCKYMQLIKISLDVYDKSLSAISFYHNNGFVDVGTMPTKHFQVIVMEKDVV